jgi:ABC-type uncharacterized transport system permease subunit
MDMTLVWSEILQILVIGLRSSSPVLAVLLGEILTQRAGIINLGVEGQMLVGAFVGVAVTFQTGNPVFGIMAASCAGVFLSSLYAFLVIGFKTNQIASGIAVLMLGTGISAYYGIPFVGQRIERLPRLGETFVGNIPVIGTLFGAFPPTVLIILLLVPVSALLLYRTLPGLRWRAVGESSEISENMGVPFRLYQVGAILVGGAFSGLGGAALSVDQTANWVEGMTNGRGLLAVGLVIVARWNLWLALPASLLYGVALALNLRMQSWGVNISVYLLSMMPYLLPLFVLMLSYRSLKSGSGGMPQGLKSVFAK